MNVKALVGIVYSSTLFVAGLLGYALSHLYGKIDMLSWIVILISAVIIVLSGPLIPVVSWFLVRSRMGLGAANPDLPINTYLKLETETIQILDPTSTSGKMYLGALMTVIGGLMPVFYVLNPDSLSTKDTKLQKGDRIEFDGQSIRKLNN